jgi:hypothetical protein
MAPYSRKFNQCTSAIEWNKVNADFESAWNSFSSDFTSRRRMLVNITGNFESQSDNSRLNGDLDKVLTSYEIPTKPSIPAKPSF